MNEMGLLLGHKTHPGRYHCAAYGKPRKPAMRSGMMMLSSVREMAKGAGDRDIVELFGNTGKATWIFDSIAPGMHVVQCRQAPSPPKWNLEAGQGSGEGGKSMLRWLQIHTRIISDLISNSTLTRPR